MIKHFEENHLMSQVVRYGPFIETAGQVAEDTSLDIEGQTRQILDSIDTLLAKAGAGKEHLIRVQIWLTDMENFERMNCVYASWLNGIAKPVRACVGSDLVTGGYLIEIQAFAYLAE